MYLVKKRFNTVSFYILKGHLVNAWCSIVFSCQDDRILLRFQFYTHAHKCPRISKSFQTSLECISSSSDLVIKLEFLSFSFTSRFVRRCFLSKRPSLHKHYLASSLLCPYPTPSHLLFFSEIYLVIEKILLLVFL